MATIAQNISRIQTAKADLKTAIEAKGVTVPSATTIDGYATLVGQIQTGGGGSSSDLSSLIDRSITSVSIPSGVTTIGYGAFYYCTSLTSVTIPNSVTTIATSAFNYCTSLTSLTIPNSVTTIGGYAFQESGLTSVTVPNSVTSIGNSAFSYCTSLTSVTIGSGVTSIGDSAFDTCRYLTSVTVEATTPPTLGSRAFASNAGTRKIYVPAESVETYKETSGWSTYASYIQAIPNS